MDYTTEDLRVIIPVGGLAKRLRPLTTETSKACIRLMNIPLVEISILGLARQGIRHFIFGVKGYHNFRDLFDYFQEGLGFSAKYHIHPRIHIKYQPNLDDFGSCDSARINLEYYDITTPTFAVQSDNIFDLNVDSLLEFHKEKGGLATICLKEVDNVEGYGVAEMDSDMRIHRFVEKPPRDQAPSNLANTGLYVFHPEIREILRGDWTDQILSERRRLDFGYDLIPYLIQSGYKVYGYVIEKGWYDVGSPQRYLEAMGDILAGRLESLNEFDGRISYDERIWIQGESPESVARREKIIDMINKRKVRMEAPVLIGRHCQIDEGVTISNSCIDNYTHIGRDSIIEDSAIMDRVWIGEGVKIQKSIIGRHVTIQSSQLKPTHILPLSTIGDDVWVAGGCTLKDAKVNPHQKLKEGIHEGDIGLTE